MKRRLRFSTPFNGDTCDKIFRPRLCLDRAKQDVAEEGIYRANFCEETKNANCKSLFPRDRPRALVGGRAAVDLRRKQNLKRNDRKTLSPSPFPSARFGRNDDSTRLDSTRFAASFIIATLVRSPASFHRTWSTRTSSRETIGRLNRISVIFPSIRSERAEMQIARPICISSRPCINIYISPRDSEVSFILLNRGYRWKHCRQPSDESRTIK